MKKLTLSALLLLSCFGNSTADPASSKPDSYSVSLIPVGVHSLIKWEKVEDYVEAEQVDPSAQPPSTIFLQEGGSDTSEKPLKVRLNSATKRISLSGKQFKLFKSSKSGENSHVLITELTLPDSFGEYSIFFLRAEGESDWRNPKTFIFTDEVESFPLGSLRVCNLSSNDLLVRFGEEEEEVAPGASLVLKSENNESLKIWSVSEDRKKLIFRRHVSPQEKDRVDLVCFLADSEKQSVKSRWIKVQPPLVPKVDEK